MFLTVLLKTNVFQCGLGGIQSSSELHMVPLTDPLFSARETSSIGSKLLQTALSHVYQPVITSDHCYSRLKQ